MSTVFWLITVFTAYWSKGIWGQLIQKDPPGSLLVGFSVHLSLQSYYFVTLNFKIFVVVGLEPDPSTWTFDFVSQASLVELHPVLSTLGRFLIITPPVSSPTLGLQEGFNVLNFLNDGFWHIWSPVGFILHF